MALIRPSRILAAALAAALVAPLVAVFLELPAGALDGQATAFWRVSLPRYAAGTLVLLSSVVPLACLSGALQAWLVHRYRFPGSRALRWASLLPFSLPSYLIAYVYADLLQVTGPVQTLLRETFGLGIGGYWFPEVRSTWFAVLVLVAALQPYVVLTVAALLRAQSDCVIDAARTLGLSARGAFARVGLPLLRPALAVGGALVAMEVLNDFGTVDHLAVDTLATGITRSWYGYGSKPTALLLAAVLLALSLATIVGERAGRGRRRFEQAGGVYHRSASRPLRPLAAALAAVFCWSWVVFGFAVPTTCLLVHATGASFDLAALAGMTGRSVALAASAAVLVALIGFTVAWGNRRLSWWQAWSRSATALGYSVPGAVVAVGIMSLLPGAIGSVALLLHGYAVRFSAIGVHGFDAALHKISPAMDEAARTLGYAPLGVARRIYAPLLGPATLTVLTLVFVDTLKELSATMILSPLDFPVLSTHIHNLASDERLVESAPAALVLVAAGLVPLLWAQRGGGGP